MDNGEPALTISTLWKYNRQEHISMTKLLMMALLVGAALAPAAAQSPAEVLYAKARNLNATMRDSSADIDVQIDATVAFIAYRPRLNGKYYYKRADKHKLELKDAPDFLKKYGSVFGLHLPQLEKYNATVGDSTDLGGRKIRKVVLTPKVKTSDIERIELYIDPERGTVPKFDTFYSKGHLYVDIDFAQRQNYWVFDKMKADISLPNVSAKASANYSHYQFNQNLPDDLFTDKQP
jgi:outer membrane lipoprotein-sorting protein